ncbi:TPA: LysR family transcriptional regulator [Stenotrophomonas maltophilia]|nr:LysR family transcriptional regulator [Stenotrophomonas maltophilia]
MELRHLRCFLAVAEELHFARAAERLHIEQSPLSRAIKDLEEELGVRWFIRNSRSTRLSRAGQVFKEHVPRIFTASQQAREGTKAVATGYDGQLRIALSDGITPPRLSAFLAKCRDDDPEVGINLAEIPLSQQIEGLRADLYDAGFAQLDDVGDGLLAKPAGFLAHGLGHAAGLTVRPHHAPVLQIHQIPLERDDFGKASSELELQANRQWNDVVLQLLGFDLVEMAEQLSHVLVADEVGSLAVGEHRNVAARVGAVGTIAPHPGQIEHAAHDAACPVRVGGLVGHLLHHRRHVRALHVLNLHAGQHRDDVAVDDALVAFLRAGLVALLGVVLHELAAQLLDRGSLTRCGLVCGRVAAPAHLGQPFLRRRGPVRPSIPHTGPRRACGARPRWCGNGA